MTTGVYRRGVIKLLKAIYWELQRINKVLVKILDEEG